MFFAFIPPNGDQFYTTSISFLHLKIETQKCESTLPLTPTENFTSQKSCAARSESETSTCTPMEIDRSQQHCATSFKSERLVYTLADNFHGQQSYASDFGANGDLMEAHPRTVTVTIPLTKSFQGWREDGVWYLPDVSYNVKKSKHIHDTRTSFMVLSTSWAPERGNRKVNYRMEQPAKHHQTHKTPLSLQPTNINRGRIPRRRDTHMRLMAVKKTSSDTLNDKSIILVATRPRHAIPEAIEKSLVLKFKKLGLQLDWFPLLLKLPPELRLKIYFFALPKERLVEMIVEGELPMNIAMRSSTTIPALLQVSFETRMEALRFYTLQFGAHKPYQHEKSRTYFDMKTDIPFLNCHRFPKMSFMLMLNMFEKSFKDVASMEKVHTMAICTGVAKFLACQFDRVLRPNTGGIEKKLFQEGMPCLKSIICVSHGKSSLGNASILPVNPDDFPTALDGNTIEILEVLFGVKLEFGVAGDPDWDEPISACNEVIRDGFL